MLSWSPWKYSFYAFSVTQPVRGDGHAPVRGCTGKPGRATKQAQQGPASSIVPIIAHFPQKSMIYAPSPRLHGGQVDHNLGLGLNKDPIEIPLSACRVISRRISLQCRVPEKNISQIC